MRARPQNPRKNEGKLRKIFKELISSNKQRMNECTRCGKCFRDQYNLGRHQSRIKPCKEKQMDVFEPSNKQINTGDKQITTTGKQNPVTPEQNPVTPEQNPVTPEQNPIIPKQTNVLEVQCEYCFSHFFNKQSLTRHYNACKAQDDLTRHLEIELEITPNVPDCKTECRFCNKVLSRVDILNKHLGTCKKKEEYHQKLLKQKEKGKQNENQNNHQINNVTININNNQQYILNYNEDYPIESTCTFNEIKDIFKEANKNNERIIGKSTESVVLCAGLMQREPQNRNIIIQPKTSTALVVSNNIWKPEPRVTVLETAFKKNARYMLNILKKMDIKKFNINSLSQIINGINQISENGMNIDDDENKLSKREIQYFYTFMATKYIKQT